MSMPQPRSLAPFFGLVFALSVPLWLLGYFAASLSDLIPIDLPVSALMAFLPAVAALWLVWREGGKAAAREFLKRSFDYRLIPGAGWYAVALLFMPGTLFLAWLAMTLAGAPLPEPHLPLLALPLFLAMFFAAGLGEELGWQGFAFDRMPAHWSALTGTLVIGAVWVAWHLIPYFQLDRSMDWVAWHCGVTLLLRIVTVWLYVNGGRSVFIAALFHAMSNVAFFMFPNYGSHYDPAYFFWIVAAAVGAILLLGGSSLTRTRR